MFDRYTEKARRAIFFARYEASALGAPMIGTEHLLLGILREEKTLLFKLRMPVGTLEEMAAECRAASPSGEKISASVDMPLNDEARQILSRAAQISQGLQHQHIGSEHLLMAMLTVPTTASQVLEKHGITYTRVREMVSSQSAPATSFIPQSTREKLNIGRAEGCVEFLYRGARVGIAAMILVNPLPRVGEEVVINRDGQFVSYKVLEVTYVYERSPEWLEHAPQKLTKVAVQVEPSFKSEESGLDYT
jgi:Clp amino terminal domain, pathogenicity island component